MAFVLGFSGYSGSGKTTLIEALIPHLKKKGFKVAVIKHDVHEFTMDREGKDTYRFTQAGADEVMISSHTRSAKISERPRTLNEMISSASGFDIVLVEGYKAADIPKIDMESNTMNAEELADWIAKKIQTDDGNVLTHFDDEGNARMVDVSYKDITERTACASAKVLVNEKTFELIKSGSIKKGDVLTVAQIAGIMGSKRTPDLIPMCHPIITEKCDVRLRLNEEDKAVEIESFVKCTGKTGVEMEAICACSVAAMTVYDMCKAVQRDIVLTDIRLTSKTGGIHGDYRAV
ncbi:MAG: cyclic pyranopterin monophosphate synthase MoaC [Lachnospiraceae bacterium]|nr:cyclic pyranopterin monophosphate synthase MoaC [Lachnospiraceae bacterium]